MIKDVFILFIIGISIFWLYSRRGSRPLLRILPRYGEQIILAILLAIFLFSLKNLVYVEGLNLEGLNLEGLNLEGLNLEGLNLEGFQDIEDPITSAAISQSLLDDTDQTQLLVNLFKKYQELLKKYTAIKGAEGLSVAECKGQLKVAQDKLEAALKQHKEYREKIRIVLPDYLKEKYILKSKVNSFINTKCDFKNYDVTKHPDFQIKCADPQYFPINKHQGYAKLLNNQIIASYRDFPVTQHPDFNNECKAKCAQQSFFDIKGHEFYQSPQFDKFEVTKHPEFETKCRAQCKEMCKNPEFFPIQEHPKYRGVIETMNQINSKAESLEKELDSIKTKNETLNRTNQQLQTNNQNLKRLCQEQLESLKVTTVQNCPDLSRVLEMVNQK